MMMDEMSAWTDNIHRSLPHQYCWVIVTVLAIACGAIIGVERGKRQKPAGLRTMMLICLGASIFAQASILVVGDRADPGRIAAQVVTGIGFLGAGAIIHGRGSVTGFTTAAAIWVVAAIGVVLGIGYAAAGVLFTLLVVGTLAAERTIESFLCGRCRWATMRIDFDLTDGRTHWRIQEILDDHQVPDELVSFATTTEEIGAVSVRCCVRHRQHRGFLATLAAMPGVRRIVETATPASAQAQEQTR
ncbi:putative Mg(2+) transport ATPase [Phycisphaerae bacterium RAS2]|nr:putative Mg(2+) transport ATPase [Phycisphaerae bacterium RAS2]